jgi:hypothetical protein
MYKKHLFAIYTKRCFFVWKWGLLQIQIKKMKIVLALNKH